MFKNCIRCGKSYYVKPYREKISKFCSLSCKALNERQEIFAICGICGNGFSHISSRCNKAKYCSRKCYRKAQCLKGKKSYKCLHCEGYFIGHAAHNRKYCSKKCVNKQKKQTWKPKYSTVRKSILARGLMERCEGCGYAENKQILGIHHKDKNRSNNEKENLSVLCPNCHSLAHRKHICH